MAKKQSQKPAVTKKIKGESYDVIAKGKLQELRTALERKLERLSTEVSKGFARIDKRFVRIDDKFVETDQRLDFHDSQLSKIIDKLLEHDTKIESLQKNMATRADMEKIFLVLDKLVKDVEDIKQEQVCTTAWLKRHNYEILELQNYCGDKGS